MIRWQISPTFHSVTSGKVESYLQVKSLVPKSPRKEPRWHQVYIIRTGRKLAADADILRCYLDAGDDDEPRLLEWTEKNPKMAQIFWPAVVELARADLYTLVPELFDLIGNSWNGDEKKVDQNLPQFQGQLVALMNAQYRRLADLYRDLNDPDRAVNFYTRALKHDPKSIETLQERAETYVALGETEKARADRFRIDQLQEQQQPEPMAETPEPADRDKPRTAHAP